MSDEWSRVAAGAVSHEAQMASAAWQFAGAQQTRPSVLFRPTLTADGTMWCALLGDDLQSGVAGFGETPALAMEAFDEAFNNERTPVSALKARGES